MCQQCNNVTLGSIEDVVKPLLLPIIVSASTIDLGEYERLALTTWFLARSMIWDAMEREHHRYYTQEQRVHFATSDPLELPPDTFMWIGTYSDKEARATFTVSNFNVSKSDAFHLLTAVLNQVVFQLVTWKGERWRIDHDTINSSPLAAKTALIWPVDDSGSIRWPLAEHLDRQSLHTLSKRFRAGDREVRGLP
jgi:hypothetical protein